MGFSIRKELVVFIVLIVTGSILINSCRKEFSCESGCILQQPLPVKKDSTPSKKDSTPKNKDTSHLIRDTTHINKDSLPHIANLSKLCASAGHEQVVFLPESSIILNGANSFNKYGNLTKYRWQQISGPSSSRIVNPDNVITSAQNLSSGIYQFEIKVSDNSGLSQSDTVKVIVANSPIGTCSSSRPTIQARLVPYGILSDNKVFISPGQTDCPCQVLFAGGFDNNPNSSVPNPGVDLFEIASHNHVYSQLSEGRQGIAVGTVGNKILFAGGGNHDIGYFSTRVDIYDAVTGKWTTTQLSEARSYMAAATLGNKVFFAGGELGNNYGGNGSPRVDIYDNSTNTWSTASLSEGRSQIVATTVGNKIYFAGGVVSFMNGTISRTIDIYDGNTNSWSVSQLNEPKSHMAAIAVGNKIFWAGGINKLGDGVASNQIEIRDVNTGISEFSCLQVGRFNLSAVLKDHFIIFFTGFNSSAATADYINQFDIYDLSSGNWLVGKLNQPIVESAMIAVKNKIYIAGGTWTGGGFTDFYNQIWTLEW